MKTALRSPFVAALVGGVVVAVAFLGFGDVGGGGETATVVQQQPIGTASVADGAGRLTAHDVYARTAPGVVFIRSQIVRSVQSPFDLFGPQAERSEATGSGFVVDEQGRILTNYHVIAGASEVTVQFGNDKATPARVTGTDPSNDLALLKVDPDKAPLKPLELGNSRNAQVGDPVLAIGNPFGFNRTLTTGVVSALQRQIEAPNGFAINNVIQTDAAINPGNSGGPLLDGTGKVIGINSQIATGGTGTGSIGIGFAVPIDTAKEVIPQLERQGRIERVWLGINGMPVDPSLNLAARRGVLVETVYPQSPAAEAGLRGSDDPGSASVGGDIILAVDGRPVSTVGGLTRLVDRHSVGEAVTLDVLRAGRRRRIEVKLDRRPAELPSQESARLGP